MTTKSISRNERKLYRRIDITHNCIRQSIGIDFAPRHCFAWCGAGESTSVRTRIGHLQKVIVSAFIDTEHFLDLWFSLQYKFFRPSATENENSRSSFLLLSIARLYCAAFGRKHDR